MIAFNGKLELRTQLYLLYWAFGLSQLPETASERGPIAIETMQ